MGKFKVGDRFSYKHANCGWQNVTVERVETFRDAPFYYATCPQEGLGGFTEDMIVAAPPSPVRTVTRREIVPGVYGGVVIDEHQHGARLVRFNAKADSTDLRAAARIFNEIADVLDEQSAEIKKEAA